MTKHSSPAAAQKAPTSHDVARAAGVSQATVSRVLRDDPNVKAATRERVMRALREIGYAPNAAARAFRTNRTGSIGVVVSRLSNQIYIAMLEAAGACLTNAGQRMIVWDSQYGGDSHASQALRQGAVDGVLVMATPADSPLLDEALSPRAPIVFLNRSVEGHPADQVSANNLNGGKQVAEYFLQTARKRIALIGSSQHISTIRDRERGFRDALADAGRPLDPNYYQRPVAFSHADGREAAIRLLELGRPPDAIFCANDVLALGALDGARARRVRVPQDLWIVGYDDIEIASWEGYDLTTVRLPMRQMVIHAVERLLRRVEDRDAPRQHIVFENELVIRGSTAGTPWPRSD